MKILFITSRIPAPTVKGDQLRAFYQLRELARKHEVFLVSFEANQPDPGILVELRQFCEEIVLVRRSLGEIICCSALSLINGLPLQVNYFNSRSLKWAVQELVARCGIELIHLQLVRTAECGYLCPGIPTVIDLVDSLALNLWNRYKFDSGVKKFAAYLEYRRMQKYEISLAKRFDRVITVSERDHVAVGSPSNGLIIPNGVDLQAFTYKRINRSNLEIVFVGNLSYFPNIDGVKWFCKDVFPLIKSVIPEAHLSIVGANPTREILNLQKNTGIVVTGWVPDVSYYLKRASVAVCPIRAGSGMQLKVLEAMASGSPLVVTSQVYKGLRARPREHLLVADEPQEFAHQVVHLLTNPQLAHNLAECARRFIESNYSWVSTVSLLEDTYRQVYDSYQPRTENGVVNIEGKKTSSSGYGWW
ncbi:MAG: glycosyltransferase family 4 protein [Carboxydocellales bacterium]